MSGTQQQPPRPRARELGIEIGPGRTGPCNAITDVPGVKVGHTTLIEGSGPLRRGVGPVRTGVTVVLPHAGDVYEEPIFAGYHWLNGNGEMTGMASIAEYGMLASPIGLTNTGSVGVVRDALIAIEGAEHDRQIWSLPVVAETWDGALNDINGQHVRAEHVWSAYRAAAGGPVAEGGVGGGTGMICHDFKGGIGTSSRVLDGDGDGGPWTVGVLVQANHGVRERLTILGAPVGELLGADKVPLSVIPEAPEVHGAGSIITLVATDAPLSPRQCTRLAQRTALAVGRTGGAGENDSGDGTLAFSTAGHKVLPSAAYTGASPDSVGLKLLSDDAIDPFFYAVIDATEEAILNALLTARTMIGRDGVNADELPGDLLLDALAHFNRGPRAGR